MNGQRPTWAEVSIPTLRANFAAVQQRIASDRAPNAQVAAVVKCDAYGHGAEACARALSHAGAQWFAVTSPQEGYGLRVAGVRQRILLLSGFYRDEADAVVANRLTPSVWEIEQLEYLSRAVAAANFKGPFPVHVEADTGMSRQGVPAAQLSAFVSAVRSKSNLQIEAIYHHYADSEVVDSPHSERQNATFEDAVRQLLHCGERPRFLHTSNSAAIATRSSAFLRDLFAQSEWSPQELVRCGIALYGYCLPFESNHHNVEPLDTVPVLSWKTRIISLREVPRATRVGYSGTHVTTRTTRIASLPVGYGDGLNRQLSNRGRVLVHGSFAPILGNVSMDMTLVDVTDVPNAAIGDEVVLIGSQGERQIDASEHADLCSTIAYEVLCSITKRVPREYIL